MAEEIETARKKQEEALNMLCGNLTDCEQLLHALLCNKVCYEGGSHMIGLGHFVPCAVSPCFSAYGKARKLFDYISKNIGELSNEQVRTALQKYNLIEAG